MTRARPLDRRTFLRGAGAAIALPWLEAMATASTPRRPVRTAVLFMPNGVRADAWTPTAVGSDFELPAILAPLAPVREHVLIPTGLSNQPTHTGDGHYVKTAGFLTGTTIEKTTGDDLNANGVSLDQRLAQRIGGTTRLPSLELSTDPVTTGIDTNVGYTRLYGSHISWSTPRTPVARETDPSRAFARLFRSLSEGGPPSRSILDLVLADGTRLRQQLGARDQARIDEYLESVRSIERRIDHDEQARATARREDPSLAVDLTALERRLASYGGDPAERIRLMIDLIVLAFRADVTRVATFMFGNAVSNRNFSFVDGVTGGHHEISHHQDKPDLLDQYQRIAAWHVAELARMIAALQACDDGDGTLLDHTTLLFGSGLRDGNRHDPNDLPILLAGRGGGAFRPGRHLAFAAGTPLCRLHLDILAAAGMPMRQFGDANRPLLTESL